MSMILTHSPTVPQAHGGGGRPNPLGGGRCGAQPRPGFPPDPTHLGGAAEVHPYIRRRADDQQLSKCGVCNPDLGIQQPNFAKMERLCTGLRWVGLSRHRGHGILRGYARVNCLVRAAVSFCIVNKLLHKVSTGANLMS